MIKNIIIIILALGFIAVVVFLDVPAVGDILSLRSQIEQQKEIFSDKQILLAKVGELTKLYQENGEVLEKTSYILPSNQDIPNLIVQLEALAFENGLVLEELTISVSEERMVGRVQETRSQEEEAPKDYETLGVNFKLIGDYLAFKNFLKAVEENIRLMDINSVNFSAESGEGLQIFNFDISLTTYYQ